MSTDVFEIRIGQNMYTNRLGHLKIAGFVSM